MIERSRLMTNASLARTLIQNWQVLRTERWQSNRVAVMSVTASPMRPRAWASIGPGGIPRMLLELDGNAHAEYARTEGRISVEVVPLYYQNEQLSVLAVQCNLEQLERVFADFCASALGRIVSGELPQAAVDGVLADLRDLLAGTAGGRKPAGSMLGLAGELLVLRDLVRHDPALLDAWQGPDGARHDFRWGEVAAEVKTYVRRQVREVTISSLDQLEPPAGGQLFLVEVCLERNAAGEITVQGLIDEIRRCVDAERMHAFLTRAKDYMPVDEEAAGPWSLKYVNSFIIGRGFPSLTESHLVGGKVQNGISHVTYRLNLAAADNWSFDGNLAEVMKESSWQDGA